jgi:hypothetical protein
MRTFSITLGTLLCSCAVASAEAPFAPFPNAVDHVVTMVIKQYGRETGERVVTHHAAWSRVDRTESGNRTTGYFDRAGLTAVSFARGNSGEYVYLSIFRGPERDRSPWLEYDSVKTGERQIFLGESCEVWRVFQDRDTRSLGSRFAKLSCVTDDGIELWHKHSGGSGTMSSAEATRIERRRVLPDDVRPPADLLVLESWSDLTPGGEPQKGVIDYETVMETAPLDPTGTGKVTRTTRRHAPWTSTESVFSGGDRTLLIENEQIRLHLRFESNTAGEFKQLTINKFAPPAVGGADAPAMKPVQDGRRETVLGEECRWFDMTPGMQDAGIGQCRTRDDIVLKEMRWSHGSSKVFEAVRLHRHAIGLGQVLPPSEILTHKNWGLPE